MERAKQIRHAGDAAEKIADKNIRRSIFIEAAIAEKNGIPQPGVVFSAGSREILSIPNETAPQTFI